MRSNLGANLALSFLIVIPFDKLSEEPEARTFGCKHHFHAL